MTRTTPTLEYLIGSRTRARLLVEIIGEPDNRVWLRELCRRTHCGPTSVRRELDAMRRARLITDYRAAEGLFFEPNLDNPVCDAIRGLIQSCDEYETNGLRRLQAQPHPQPSAQRMRSWLHSHMSEADRAQATPLPRFQADGGRSAGHPSLFGWCAALRAAFGQGRSRIASLLRGRLR